MKWKIFRTGKVKVGLVIFGCSVFHGFIIWIRVDLHSWEYPLFILVLFGKTMDGCGQDQIIILQLYSNNESSWIYFDTDLNNPYIHHIYNYNLGTYFPLKLQQFN